MIKRFYALPSLIAISLLHCFKFVRFALGPKACRFYPSCTQYSLESIKKYGFLKGIYLSFKRVIKCHPFNAGGYDPVP